MAGTDASGWGTGQLVWLDGHREETVLQFGEAEQRRPINWRELLGIVRVVEVWGARMRGRAVLIETDNLTAWWAARRCSAKSPDMRELVRRLLTLCELHDVDLRLTHTPGTKLHRPDQTSRGEPVEEPRQRLGAREFRAIEARHGPFSEFVGAERWLAEPGETGGGGARLWLHPSFATVGTALRMVLDRAEEAGAAGVRAVVLVPDEPTAQWWPLAQSFALSGRLAAGGEIEENRLGVWCSTQRRRGVLILSYPRSAGATVEAVHLDPFGISGRGGGFGREGYTFDARAPARFRLSRLPGTLYVARAVEGEMWRLFIGQDGLELDERVMRLAPLAVAGKVASTGGQRVTFRSDGLAAETWDADDVFAVGGALVSEVSIERSRRLTGAATRVFEVRWPFVCELATSAANGRQPLAGRGGSAPAEDEGSEAPSSSGGSIMSLARRFAELGDGVREVPAGGAARAGRQRGVAMEAAGAEEW